MKKDFESLTIHHKMVLLVEDLVDRELSLNEAMTEIKRIYIQTAAKKHNGVKTRMAEALGVHRNTLNNLVKSLNIKT